MSPEVKDPEVGDPNAVSPIIPETLASTVAIRADGIEVVGRKGIILAGGTGSRLHPITLATSKQLLPVYDKPMVYYPLTVLMLAGITEILVITTPHDRDAFERLLGDGSRWGISLSLATQAEPKGIAEAFIIAEEFLAGSPSALILGDNLFYGSALSGLLQQASASTHGAQIFAQRVADPHRYGVVVFDDNGQATAIIEKPKSLISNWAVTGLYFFDPDVVAMAKQLKPSARGELEIADINQAYLDKGRLQANRLDRGFAWFDTGTFDAMVEAAEFVRVLEHRQHMKIGCPEEVAYRLGLISDEQLLSLAAPLEASGYGKYLRNLLSGP